MRGPYRVVKVLPHGRYELELLAGSYGKSTQAAAEYMIPWRGEWTPEVCAAYFDDADHEDEEFTLATAGSTSSADHVVVHQPESCTSKTQAETSQHLLGPKPVQLQVEPEPLQLQDEPELLQLHTEPERTPADIGLSMPMLETNHQS